MVKKFFLAAIRLYQKTISPDHGLGSVFFKNGFCRFHPSCSQYIHDSVSVHGALRGSLLGLKRLARCHPFSHGGNDPVPKSE